jgi:transposase InsO family protein
MPWKEYSTMSQRREFVTFALSQYSHIRALCRLYGISPKTGYKWISRYLEAGESALGDRSRRPHHSPKRTAEDLEEAVLAIRDHHPAWGGRKIGRILQSQGFSRIPAPSTITEILRRHARLNPEESAKHKAWERFEHEAPNRLWQMDFKGDFPLQAGGRCYPLTILDDHSRFAVCLRGCGDQRGSTVEPVLETVFRRYGLPEAMIMDNGSPWGLDGHAYTQLAVWLIRLDISVSHCRPYHPQTLGKEERFHRTLKTEVLMGNVFDDLDHCQRRFDDWRDTYNLIRPHEALGMKTPAQCYYPSPRAFPEVLEPIDYAPGAIVRKVQDKGEIYYKGRAYILGRAFHGYPVALRHTEEDGILDVYFCHQRIAHINLRVT